MFSRIGAVKIYLRFALISRRTGSLSSAFCWFSQVTAMITLLYPSFQSSGMHVLNLSILLVHIRKSTSFLCFMISQASLRQISASSMKKSDVKQVAISLPAAIFQGQIKIGFRFGNNIWILISYSVQIKNIAIFTARAAFMAAMPWIP